MTTTTALQPKASGEESRANTGTSDWVIISLNEVKWEKHITSQQTVHCTIQKAYSVKTVKAESNELQMRSFTRKCNVICIEPALWLNSAHSNSMRATDKLKTSQTAQTQTTWSTKLGRQGMTDVLITTFNRTVSCSHDCDIAGLYGSPALLYWKCHKQMDSYCSIRTVPMANRAIHRSHTHYFQAPRWEALSHPCEGC